MAVFTATHEVTAIIWNMILKILKLRQTPSTVRKCPEAETYKMYAGNRLYDRPVYPA